MADERMRFRPEVGESYSPYKDAVGRTHPHKVSVLTFVKLVPEMHARFFRGVPPEYWALDVTDDGYTTAAVSCPCGQTPVIEVGTLGECECERFFWFTGRKVMVANSPRDRVPEPETSAPS